MLQTLHPQLGLVLVGGGRQLCLGHGQARLRFLAVKRDQDISLAKRQSQTGIHGDDAAGYRAGERGLTVGQHKDADRIGRLLGTTGPVGLRGRGQAQEGRDA